MVLNGDAVMASYCSNCGIDITGQVTLCPVCADEDTSGPSRVWLGIHFRPTFKSYTGNGRVCSTVQGWEAYMNDSWEWFPTQIRMKQHIGTFRVRWEQGRLTTEASHRTSQWLIELWGPQKSV